ncbi:MAG: ABC transporter substrate-binding protein [Chitinophagaceae bacterium]|nr:ABC transporter substrate-binding protein [Chitinophagaceae bacterium]
MLSNSAGAQFWKSSSKTRKVNSGNKYPIKATTKPSPKVEKKKEVRKKQSVNLPVSVAKTRYRIDVLLPLYLDDLVIDDKVIFKGKIPDRAQAGINFYEGIQLAVDTLTQMGYKTDVYVHDINAKDTTIELLLQNGVLKNTDLILGYVSNADVLTLANYAAKNHVNFISAFSPSDANIIDNPYFFLLNPTLENNCNALVASIIKKQKDNPIIIIKRESIAVDSSAYRYIVEAYQDKELKTVDCSLLPDSAELVSVLDSAETNIVIMPIMDAYYAEKMIQNFKKYFPTYRFEIYGMPTWKGITTNRKMIELGSQYSINITQPYYFESANSLGQSIAQQYKTTFGGVPNELTYRGFELVFWLTDLLNKYGTIFNEKTSDKQMAPFTKYELKPKWDKENKFYYYENKHLYLFQFQSGTFKVQ